MNATSPQLGVVQETLLIPLYFRAMETRRADAIVHDPIAVQIVDSLDYDFSKFDSAWTVYLDIVIRTELFDQRVRAFIDRHPQCVVINLGAGLCGRFHRIDNGCVRWFDQDMPDAIALRRQFFTEGPRNRVLSGSMFDHQWMEEVTTDPAQPVLIVAEGLFCYFEESQLRMLLAAIAKRWPGAEIIFQSISRRFVNRQHEVGAVNRTGATFKWGIDSGHEVAAWDPAYQFLDEWYFIDRHRRRWRWLRYTSLLPWVHRNLARVMKVSHMRLGLASEPD